MKRKYLGVILFKQCRFAEYSIILIFCVISVRFPNSDGSWMRMRDFREDPVILKTQVLCNTHINFEKKKQLKRK